MFRSLSRRPVFAIAAILTVAVGIGANTALFGVIYSVLIQPLPFRDPGRLVQIWETHPALPQLQVTAPDFADWREQTHSFADMAAYTLSAMNNVTLLGEGEPEALHATMAGSNFFPLMGIRPVQGRVFDNSQERVKERIALISEKLWRRKFASDASLIGRQIRLGTESFQVIGVIAQRQAFPEWADLWIPLSLMEPELQSKRKFHPLEVIARLNDGVTAEQAQEEMRAVARRLAQAHPDTNATIGAYVIPLALEITGSVRQSLLITWAAVGLVLLIACANLAQLFLARIIERRQEMAIREMLGAGSRHLIRQLLGESLLVAGIGGLAGAALAAWASLLAQKLARNEIPRLEWMTFSGPIWLFAAVITLFAGVLFGLPACWRVTRGRRELVVTGRSITRARSRMSALLMTFEVAVALLVLWGAVLLTRNFAALLNEDLGFQAKQVWAIPSVALGNSWDKAEEFLKTRLAPVLQSTAGVVDVAAVNSAPMSLGATEHSRFATRFGIEGRTFNSGSYPVAQNRWMTPEYFRVLGIPLKSGRWLTESDRNRPRVLVNETLARRFFPNQDAVGRRLLLGVMDPKQTANEIAGVVGDVRDLGLDQEVAPTMYGLGVSPVMTLLVRTKAGSNMSATLLRDALHRASPEIPIAKIQPLEQNVSESLAKRRFALTLLTAFGIMAAFLTAGGIFGLLTQSVNARIREFGVRLAVGAAPAELVLMILREAIVLTLPGLFLGAILSLSFTGVMKSLVYRLSPNDPVSIASAAAFLVVLILLSAWLPARRAAAVDPAVALRAD